MTFVLALRDSSSSVGDAAAVLVNLEMTTVICTGVKRDDGEKYATTFTLDDDRLEWRQMREGPELCSILPANWLRVQHFLEPTADYKPITWHPAYINLNRVKFITNLEGHGETRKSTTFALANSPHEKYNTFGKNTFKYNGTASALNKCILEWRGV